MIQEFISFTGTIPVQKQAGSHQFNRPLVHQRPSNHAKPGDPCPDFKLILADGEEVRMPSIQNSRDWLGQDIPGPKTHPNNDLVRPDGYRLTGDGDGSLMVIEWQSPDDSRHSFWPNISMSVNS